MTEESKLHFCQPCIDGNHRRCTGVCRNCEKECECQ